MRLASLLETDLTVTDEVEVRGAALGDTEVGAGGVLILRGFVSGDLYVLPGGRAEVHGFVRQTIVNCGGDITLHASATCAAVVDEDGARTKIDDHARILLGRLAVEKGMGRAAAQANPSRFEDDRFFWDPPEF